MSGPCRERLGMRQRVISGLGQLARDHGPLGVGSVDEREDLRADVHDPVAPTVSPAATAPEAERPSLSGLTITPDALRHTRWVACGA